MRKKKTTSEKLTVGRAFLQYLKINNKGDEFGSSELGEIYRNEYKNSPGAVSCRGCCFSSVLYTLRTNGKVKCKNKMVSITAGFLARDQYSTLERHLQDLSMSGAGKHPFYCATCDVKGNSQKSFLGHLMGKKHLQQMTYKFMKKEREQLIKGVNGIQVSSDYDGEPGVISLSMPLTFKETTFNIKVENNGKSANEFLACLMLKVQPSITMEPVQEDLVLYPGMEYNIKVRVKANCISVLQSPLLLVFKPEGQSTVFQILRFLKIRVESDIANDLPPTIPYIRQPKHSVKHSSEDIVDGLPLLKESDSKLKLQNLKLYHVPNYLRYQTNNKDCVDDVTRNIDLPLTWENYARKFSDLLHIEECQMEVDIRKYDMEGVTMKKDGKTMKLRVPGLAENRPSVLRGDHLFARFSADRNHHKIRTYKGYVHDVELEELRLGFAREFLDRFLDGTKVDIEFTFNRLPLRLQHFAIEQVPVHDNLKEVLFPMPENLGYKELLHDIPDGSTLTRQLYDRKLASNTEQTRAIQHILQGTSRPAPYLVFGPPGTGKTVTIVEAIKQVFKVLGRSRILACAPSNSAADLIAKRLLSGAGTPVDKANLFRVNALSRDWKNVDQTLKEKECCNYDKITGDNFFPCKEDLMKKRILVTTLCTAGRLATAKDFPLDHFTHVFIDEAGHAMEPEAIISLSNILNPDNLQGGQVVLAGDPKQLGPVLRSPLALEHGLELSLLERLMTDCKVYKRRAYDLNGDECEIEGDDDPYARYDSRVLTKLLCNYRSHPAILKLPNQMFYANELEVHADQLMRESLCQWETLPKKGFPVIFHGVEGLDEREGRSPSFFNKSEIEIVVKYAQDLLEKRGSMRVKASDIGIISPYRRQVQKIKEVLKKRKITDIKVGSVEEFQGQERLVIIVSTVRSTKPEHIQMDIDFKLGFVKNPKRLNVAVTRAKALLILIGNPYMLRMDENWNMFLEYCLDNDAYVGCNLTNADDELDDVIQKLQSAEITTKDDPKETFEMTVSRVTEQQDPEWRSEAC